MLRKVTILILFHVGIIVASKAQNAWDAMRYSKNWYEGTARFTAMGGAFAALGGDFTTLSINPAGIGVYRGVDLSMSMGIDYNRTSANYRQEKNDDSYTHFGFSNFGLVLGNVHGNTGLVSLNFGVGYNKINNVKQRISASGVSYNSSKLSSLAIEMEGRPEVEFDDKNAFSNLGSAYWPHIMAYFLYLVEADPSVAGGYIAAVENDDLTQSGPLRQDFFSEETGSTGEFTLSVGGNISNEFYFGATVGIQSLWNDYYMEYSETAVDPSNFDTPQNETEFQSFLHKSEVNTRGTGFNLKMGFIWRPAGGLRWGAYFHTPTWMYLTDEYSQSMHALFSNTLTADKTPLGAFDYRINTPMKWGTGLAYTFGNFGMISVEYEGQDFSMIRMLGHENGRYRRMTGENDYIKNNFKLVTNIRAGAEVRLNQFSIRAGYAYYGSPVKNDNSFARNVFSAGLGYRIGDFYIDGTYAFSPNNEEHFEIYGGSSELTTTSTAGRIILTLGFRF
jgi:hypothetical protein